MAVLCVVNNVDFAILFMRFVLSYGSDCTVLNRQTWNEPRKGSRQIQHSCGRKVACACKKLKNRVNGFEDDDRIYKRVVSLPFPFSNTVRRFNLQSRMTGVLPGVFFHCLITNHEIWRLQVGGGCKYAVFSNYTEYGYGCLGECMAFVYHNTRRHIPQCAI